MLSGKHILVGLTGGIACYKTASLVRLLVKNGAEVRVVMTEHAKQFITPLTMATLSQHPILTEFFDPTNGNWNSHVKLGIWTDLYVIAPASANTLAKMASGVADNLLLTTYLSMRGKVLIAPAMDLDMWQHPTTQRNLRQLQADGVQIIEPNDGFLASGLTGKGRMAEPEMILSAVLGFCGQNNKSERQATCLITAGPTQEKIDPVRFISNHSSGKMGYALANEAVRRGYKVNLVTGPVNILPPTHPNIHVIKVTSAQEMADASLRVFPSCDIAILAAAVADFTPVNVSDSKIKKDPQTDNLSIELKKTTDIAATIGSMKSEKQKLVGFALETDHEMENAISKLQSKNMDCIVLNSLNDKGAGFGGDTNKVTIIHKSGEHTTSSLMNKQDIARFIFDNLQQTEVKN